MYRSRTFIQLYGTLLRLMTNYINTAARPWPIMLNISVIILFCTRVIPTSLVGNYILINNASTNNHHIHGKYSLLLLL